MKKTIYFVRHGESEGNAGGFRQTASAQLTDAGLAQANLLADRCARLSFEVIISSAFVRARQTAKIISDRTNKPMEELDLLMEWRRPKEQIGIPVNDPIAVAADRAIMDNFGAPDFRFSTEETFDELKTRVAKALQYLSDRPEQNILAVTHGFFMRIVAAYVLMGEGLTATECLQFIRKCHLANTSITVVNYDGSDKTAPWKLWVWNDHAHLG